MPKLPIPEDLLMELLGRARADRPDVARFTQPAYRHSSELPNKPNRQHRWWFPQPDQANSYGRSSNYDVRDESQFAEGAITLPGDLDTRGFLEVDAQGQSHGSIPIQNVQSEAFQAAHQSDLPIVSTDTIAAYADQTGIPGVIFRNVREEDGVIGDQYYVSDPTRRRARFAAFQDPKSPNIMSSTLLSLLGLGGAASLSGDDEES